MLPCSTVRFRKGLGRFSSSAKSYSGDGWDRGVGSVTARVVVVAECRCGCGRGLGWTCDEDVLVTAKPVGSETEEGTGLVLFSVGRLDVLMEGLRSRVGGAVADVEADDPGSDTAVPLSFDRLEISLSFLEVGLGGGLWCSTVDGTPAGLPLRLSSSSSSPSPKSKILAKLSPTLGELLNRLANSAGVGVASISPVAVRTTPFIADGM